MKTSWLQTGAAAVFVVGSLAVVATAQNPPTPAQATPPLLPPPSGQTAPAQITPQVPLPAQTAPLPSAPVPPALPQPGPQVFTWPGGSMVVNGSEVIMRTTGPRGVSSNVISGSGNGIGNRIVVGNGGAGGTTYIHGSRNGIGNRIVVDSGDLLIDIDAILKDVPAIPLKPVLPVIPPAAEPAAFPAPAAAPVPRVAPAAAPSPSYKGKDNPFWSKKQFSDAHDCNLYWDPVTKLWFRYGAEDDTYRPVASPPAPPQDDK